LIAMFFSKKERDRDFGEIKDLVEEDDPPVRHESQPRHARAEPQFAHEEIPSPRDTGAPLFVKVDKYRELMASIHEVKLYLGATKQVFSLFNDIESVRAESLNVLRATVQRLERTIVEMDSELLRPKGGIPSDRQEVAEVTHIESSLTDLHKQLMDLKRDLSDLK
jgi:hypothetical protein